MSALPVGVAALAAALSRKTLSAVEATEAYLARIERTNGALRAFIHVAGDAALDQARAADARRARKQALGPLDGVPIAAKDNIDVAGWVSTGGIGHYRDQVATDDAFVMRTLREAGAVFLGKLNMHEAALGATTDNPWFGRCENPRRPGYTPGGSSGGSGAAVAAELCAAALGTDTLGSVRIPAAYCGVAGIKPTYGVLSTRGVMPISWTLDHVGYLAPRVEDLRLMLAASARYDAGWPFARRAPLASPALRNHDAVAGLRVGHLRGLERAEVEPELLTRYDEAMRALAGAGAQLVAIDLEGYEYTRVRRECLLLIEVEGAAVHGEAIARDPEGFSPELRGMLAFGAKQTATRTALSYRRLHEARALLGRAFAGVDCVVLPTAPQVAFAFGAPVPASQADLTGLANILEAPSGCAPWGAGRAGLPASIQVIARPFADELVLDVLRSLERMAPAV
jgi:aspartyl-tRNA(Asn)/glutamyl-tRNA(Gln) amidotransferase subunit A